MLGEDASQAPLPSFHLHGFTVLLLKQVWVKRNRKKKEEKKRRSNVKESQSESNHWPSTTMIGLITVCQMQLAGPSSKILTRKYTLSPSISFKKWQRREESRLPEATGSSKIRILWWHQSITESYNQNVTFSESLPIKWPTIHSSC